MKTLPREKANAVWNKWWDEMRHEWFKVEVLQDYSGEDAGPSLDNWLKGNQQKSIELIKSADYSKWVESCRRKHKEGVKLVRIHVIKSPLSPYMEWEIEHYKLINVAKCRERVYLINRSETADLNLPPGDLMIFDKRRAVINTYNVNARMTHQTFYDERDDITKFLVLRKKIIELAKSL